MRLAAQRLSSAADERKPSESRLELGLSGQTCFLKAYTGLLAGEREKPKCCPVIFRTEKSAHRRSPLKDLSVYGEVGARLRSVTDMESLMRISPDFSRSLTCNAILPRLTQHHAKTL
jgi:hypothetical protein